MQSLLKNAIIACAVFFATPASARCALPNYVLQDQRGRIAEVQRVRECYGWYDRTTRRSSDGCKTYRQTNREIEKRERQYKKADLRIIGITILSLAYRNEIFFVSRPVVVGIPTVWFEVIDDLHTIRNLGDFVEIMGFVDYNFDFDFSKEPEVAPWSAKVLFKKLYGLKFTLKRCNI